MSLLVDLVETTTKIRLVRGFEDLAFVNFGIQRMASLFYPMYYMLAFLWSVRSLICLAYF